LMEEHITSMAGAQGGTSLEPEDLRSAITALGRVPQQRTTLYQPLEQAPAAPAKLYN